MQLLTNFIAFILFLVGRAIGNLYVTLYEPLENCLMLLCKFAATIFGCLWDYFMREFLDCNSQ